MSNYMIINSLLQVLHVFLRELMRSYVQLAKHYNLYSAL